MTEKIFLFCLSAMVLHEVAKANSQLLDLNEKFGMNLYQLPQIWLDLKYVRRFIKTIVILEGSRASAKPELPCDLFADLIDYIPMLKPLPVVILNANVLTNSSVLRFKPADYVNAIENLKKQLFVIAFDSLQSLNFTIYDTKWYVFDKAKTANFILVIKMFKLQEAECFSDHFSQSLKEVMGDYFETIWKRFNIIEVFLILPYLCGKELILRYDFTETFQSGNYSEGVTILTKEILETKATALLHQYSDFKKYPLKINLFTRIPTLVEEMPKTFLESYLRNDIKDVNNVGGLDGFILGNLIERLNFNPIIGLPTDNGQYGKKERNNTFSGSLGDIILKKMDISMNSRFIKLYHTEDIEFTYPIFSDQFCILVPKALPVPQWMSIFLIFSLKIWGLIFLSITSLGILWWLIKTKLDDEGRNERVFCTYFMEVCCIFLSNPVKLPTMLQERMFISLCLLFNLIVAGVFQGHLSTAYSTVSYNSEINTLEELDASGLSISSKNNKDLFVSNVSTVENNLLNKMKETGDIADVARERNTAIVERRIDAGIVIQHDYTNSVGEPLIHIMEECPRSYYLAYIVYKGHPFLRHIDTFLKRIVAAGLNNKWYDLTDYSLLLQSRMRQTHSTSEKSLTLCDVQASFMFLGIGLILSKLIFIYEIISFKRYKNSKVNVLIGVTASGAKLSKQYRL